MCGDRHMRLGTFLYKIQFRITFIWSFFGFDAYFWQRSELKWIWIPISVHYKISNWGYSDVMPWGLRSKRPNLVNCINLELGLWIQPWTEIAELWVEKGRRTMPEESTMESLKHQGNGHGSFRYPMGCAPRIHHPLLDSQQRVLHGGSEPLTRTCLSCAAENVQRKLSDPASWQYVCRCFAPYSRAVKKNR